MNNGVLFKNFKNANSNKPDYTGGCTLKGTEYEIAAWIKTSKNKDKYLSLTFTGKKNGNNGAS